MAIQYTKKVIDHFKNPHNMGQIKDADGVGQVGNPVCLPLFEKIHINNDVVNITKINDRTRVFSHDGRYNNVIQTAWRNYNGEIITIKNKLGEVNLTPEHLVLAVKIPKGNKFLRNKNKRTLFSAWYHTKDLQKGDIVLYPILKEIIDTKFIDIDIPRLKWDFKSKKIPKKIMIDPGFLRLSGYYLAEGCVNDKPCKTYIMFVLNIAERDIALDIKKICQKLFNLSVKFKEIPQRKTLQVFIYSAILARFFKKLFRKYADKKKIPQFIMLLSPKKQRSLIYSLWKGDGYINLKRQGPRAGYSTISYQLAQQIKTLLLRQNIAVSIYKENKCIKNGVKHRESYRLHVGQRDSLDKLCKILKLKYCPKSYNIIDSWFDNNYLYTPITQTKKINYSGKVYNLEVKNSHSFINPAFCLHNCGDMMKLYIKVDQNKKGEKIISDIKFETLGCAAAIATSSIITDIAKSKTLEEAKKITRQDVADDLGGLPPIKMHCSNLSSDALRAAIEDYEKKTKKLKNI